MCSQPTRLKIYFIADIHRLTSDLDTPNCAALVVITTGSHEFVLSPRSVSMLRLSG